MVSSDYWYEMRKQAEGIVRLDYGIRQVRLEQNEAHAIASVQTAYTHFSINYIPNFHIFFGQIQDVIIAIVQQIK